jgi:hypothetical protein
MSDDPATFRRKVQAQADLVKRQINAIAQEYIILVSTDAVKRTRGFGNQRPGRRSDGTGDIRYTPTGQLRGGWFWSNTPYAGVTYFEGGPESDYGDEPVEAITSQVRSGPVPMTSYVQNAVAYGYIVKKGLGNHSTQDLWLDEIAASQDSYAEQARITVMRGGVG